MLCAWRHIYHVCWHNLQMFAEWLARWPLSARRVGSERSWVQASVYIYLFIYLYIDKHNRDVCNKIPNQTIMILNAFHYLNGGGKYSWSNLKIVQDFVIEFLDIILQFYKTHHDHHDFQLWCSEYCTFFIWHLKPFSNERNIFRILRKNMSLNTPKKAT